MLRASKKEMSRRRLPVPKNGPDSCPYKHMGTTKIALLIYTQTLALASDRANVGRPAKSMRMTLEKRASW